MHNGILNFLVFISDYFSIQHLFFKVSIAYVPKLQNSKKKKPN